MRAVPGVRISCHQKEERLAWLGFVPLFMTGVFYLLPRGAQSSTFIQFLPQIFSYLGLLLWISCNTHIDERLGLGFGQVGEGIRWGGVVGFLLGILNTSIILWVVPWWGGDIGFLKETPHAKVPLLVMMPWFILGIAALVELNFRGFLLGRLAVMWERGLARWYGKTFSSGRAGAMLAVWCSALAFSFDPFMVETFQYLHWIAVWDGIIWGWLRLRLNNLWAAIVAHAVEVMIMYWAIRAVLV